MRAAAVLGLLTLGACVATSAPMIDMPVTTHDPAACGADGLQGLIGQPRSVLDGMRFSQPFRVLTPGMVVTEEYRQNRLNIAVDDADKIIRVACG